MADLTLAQAAALHRSGDLAAARAAYESILQRGADGQALANLGLIHWAEGEAGAARAALQQAMALQPDLVDHPYNLGTVEWQAGDLTAAAEAYERALQIDPAHRATLQNLAAVYLGLGRLAEGWRLLDTRPERDRATVRAAPFPEWRGEPLAGKTLLVWIEQGFGDTILASRFVAGLVATLGAAKVTLACRPPLARLFEQLPAQVQSLDGPTDIALHDYWVLPLSLPRWVQPQACPYLSAAPAAAKGRIGVMWRGNPLPDPMRSLPDALGEQLLRLPGAISLQPEDTGAADFAETAAIIAGLDHVISIDTSVAHLAGAMGKAGTVLLQHHSTDWRWRAGEDGRSAWYPSLRLLRQPGRDDWTGCVEALEREFG